MMMILAIWLSFFTPREADHDFYVSITELEIKDDTLQMSLRLFTDDLERALNDRSEEKIFLETNNPSRKNFVHIKDYLNDSYKVGNGARNQPIEWLGHEFEDDVCWIYGQVAIPEDQSIIFVTNKVLMDAFEDQQNILHYKRTDGVETGLATKSRPEVRFIK